MLLTPHAETPYQAAIEELDTIQAEDKDQDEEDKEPDTLPQDTDAAVESEMNSFPEESSKAPETNARRTVKSARGVIEAPAFESPSVDIFGNPEQDDTW